VKPTKEDISYHHIHMCSTDPLPVVLLGFKEFLLLSVELLKILKVLLMQYLP